MYLTYIGAALLAALFFLAAWLIIRRERGKRKIRSMREEEKAALLTELAAPFGFRYLPEKDIFTSTLDAWQRREGYEMLYDRLAPRFQMVFDALPVYYDYQGKTWLAEFWKGQYGINTGCEAGIYHANRHIPASQRRLVHYNAASDREMPLIHFCLEKDGAQLFSHRDFHWWLTGFRMGAFSQPEELAMYVKISFLDRESAQAFYQGLLEAGYSEAQCRLQRQTVLFAFAQGEGRSYRESENESGKGSSEKSWNESSEESRKGSRKWRWQECGQEHRKGCREKCGQDRRKRCGQEYRQEHRRRNFAQMQNRIFCSMYRLATRPFDGTADRMLFLYFQLPRCFRHMMRLHSFGRKNRQQGQKKRGAEGQ